MIESPVITEWQAEGVQKAILGLLASRFGSVPADLKSAVTAIMTDLDRLIALNTFAASCPDLDAFRRQLSAGTSAPAAGSNPAPPA